MNKLIFEYMNGSCVLNIARFCHKETDMIARNTLHYKVTKENVIYTKQKTKKNATQYFHTVSSKPETWHY